MISWPTTIKEATEIQGKFARLVRLHSLEQPLRTVCGVDAAYCDGEIIAVATLFDFATLTPRAEASAVVATPFPYVPGYLSFREGPAILTAVARLPLLPDLILVDGQGIAHPRGLGIASLLGVLFDRPAIGCAKTRLIGEYAEPAANRGSWSPLLLEGATVGAALRTRSGVKPLFVSAGHRITLPEAIDIVLHCSGRYRLPEPQRAADQLAGRIKRQLLAA